MGIMNDYSKWDLIISIVQGELADWGTVECPHCHVNPRLLGNASSKAILDQLETLENLNEDSLESEFTKDEFGRKYKLVKIYE